MNTTTTAGTTVTSNVQFSKCPWCSTDIQATYHQGRCPNVKAFEYDEQGNVKRVEFFSPADYVAANRWYPDTLRYPNPLIPTLTTILTHNDSTE